MLILSLDEKPLRRKPMLLIPPYLNGSPTAVTNGGTSCETLYKPLINECAPIFTN